jgi:hypothetical protein
MLRKIIIGTLLIIIVLAILKFSSDNKTANQSVQPASKDEKTEAKLDYLLIHLDKNGRVENYEILIQSGAYGKAAALDVKKQCKKPCNIFVYDSAKAQQLQREYDEISDGASATIWMQENYVYVADHLVGNIDFETGEYTAYPYRDSQYRELGGKY